MPKLTVYRVPKRPRYEPETTTEPWRPWFVDNLDNGQHIGRFDSQAEALDAALEHLDRRDAIEREEP